MTSSVRATVLAASLVWALSGCSSYGSSPKSLEDAELDWTEAEVPPPPGFDEKKLVLVDQPSGSQLTYSVAPETIVISKADGVIRYVMVAANPSGARNVMYEGLRCSKAEYKTYARASSDGRWSRISNPEWRSLYGNSLSPHTLRFARAGACDNAAPASSVQELLSRLKVIPLPGGKN
jgi:CNP1-like family